MKNFLFYLLYFNVAVGVISVTFIDVIVSADARQTDTTENCVCKGPSCLCCIDFNVSFIDLGGPGCVTINYRSLQREIDMNITYGDSYAHHEHIKDSHSVPSCLNLLSTFAQICAKFNELIPTENGFRGCLQIEPTLLGEPQLEFNVGCFDIRPDAIKQVQPIYNMTVSEGYVPERQTKVNNVTTIVETSPDLETDSDINAEDILTAVNESANKGIAFISDWLGISITNNSNARK